MPLLTWLFLVYAAATKVAYVLKNMFESLEIPTTKKFMVTVIVIAEAALQFMIVKFAFIRTGGANASVLSHHAELDSFHLRNYMEV
ncbi:unnamed protein product [Sphagnum balticum]